MGLIREGFGDKVTLNYTDFTWQRRAERKGILAKEMNKGQMQKADGMSRK